MSSKSITLSLGATLTLIVLGTSASTLEITSPDTSNRFAQESLAVQGKDQIYPNNPPGIQVRGWGWDDGNWVLRGNPKYADWDLMDPHGYGYYDWMLDSANYLETDNFVGDFKVEARYWVNGEPRPDLGLDTVEFEFVSS